MRNRDNRTDQSGKGPEVTEIEMKSTWDFVDTTESWQEGATQPQPTGGWRESGVQPSSLIPYLHTQGPHVGDSSQT